MGVCTWWRSEAGWSAFLVAFLVELGIPVVGSSSCRRRFVLAAYTSFRDADLTGANLWQLKACRCDFTGARLTGATLSGVSAVECRFESTDFTEATAGTADATRATDEAAEFCKRFGIAIDRSGRYTNDDADAAYTWHGPCDFTGSTGLAEGIEQMDRMLS